MDEIRFTRLEEKVDGIKDSVADLKTQQSVTDVTINKIEESFEKHIELISKHITNDTNIANEIKPLLSSIPNMTEMLEDYTFRKESKKRRNAKLKELSLKIGIPLGFFSLVSIFFKIFNPF